MLLVAIEEVPRGSECNQVGSVGPQRGSSGPLGGSSGLKGDLWVAFRV